MIVKEELSRATIRALQEAALREDTMLPTCKWVVSRVRSVHPRVPETEILQTIKQIQELQFFMRFPRHQPQTIARAKVS